MSKTTTTPTKYDLAQRARLIAGRTWSQDYANRFGKFSDRLADCGMAMETHCHRTMMLEVAAVARAAGF